MKKLFLILFILTSLSVISQSKKIAKNIALLNNSEFLIDHSAKAKFEVKSSAGKSLIKIGKPATEKLIEALSDSTKNIMAHWALCHIYYRSATFAGPKEHEEGGLTIYKYFLGQEKGEGLILSEVKENGKYTLFVKPDDLKTIITFWKKKLIKN